MLQNRTSLLCVGMMLFLHTQGEYREKTNLRKSRNPDVKRGGHDGCPYEHAQNGIVGAGVSTARKRGTFLRACQDTEPSPVSLSHLSHLSQQKGAIV